MIKYKYGNKKVSIQFNGSKFTFDSKAEYSRYCYLSVLQQIKVISDLELQPAFQLLDSFSRNGKKHRATTYIADFSYYQDEKRVIEDVKGMKTAVYELKKKLFLSKYGEGLTFIEVMFARNKFTEKEI